MLAGTLALMACYSNYQPGTLAPVTGVGAVQTAGCLDIAVEPVDDQVAAGPVAEIRLGNRCDGAVLIDLASIAATVRLDDGRVGVMRVYDPMGVIRPALLDGRSMAREVLEYHLVPGEAHGRAARQLCLDFRAVDQNDPSPLPVVSCVPLPSETVTLNLESAP